MNDEPHLTANNRTALPELIPLPRVPQLLPGKVHHSTVYRWASRGLGGRQLRTVKVGRTRCTTAGWLLEFFERSSAADGTKGEPQGVKSKQRKQPKQRRPRQQHEHQEASRRARELLGLDRDQPAPLSTQTNSNGKKSESSKRSKPNGRSRPAS